MDSLHLILQIVAVHPWMDAEQASALTGLSLRQVDRIFACAAREGYLQVCRVAGLCTHGALYALKRRALTIVSTGSPASLERRLLQIEPLWGARNLLAHLARNEILMQPFSPGRLSLPAEATLAQADHARASLDVLAWGTLKRDNRLLPFVIEWDLGKVAPEAYRDRFAGSIESRNSASRSSFPSG